MSPVVPPDSLGTALVPEITANGALLPATFINGLVEARLQTAVRTIGRCTLRFRDPSYELATTSTLKVGVVVVLAGRTMADGAKTTMFTGTVTSVAYEQRPGQSVDLVVVVEDAAFKLSRNARALTYLKQKYSEIVATVAKDAGLRHNINATPDVHEYVLQSDTDLRFIDEIARRIGWEWMVDHEGRFHFWSSWNGDQRDGTLGGAVTLTAGEDLHSFSVKVWSDGLLTANVRGWDQLEKSAVAAKVTARPSIPDTLARTAGIGSSSAEVLDARSNPTNQAEAKAIATWRARGAGTVAVRGRTWGTPTLRPGVLVDLKGVGPAAGKYFVHEVRHIFGREGLVTEFVAGDRESFGLGDAAEADVPASFGHQGLVVAVVSNIADPDKLGRVKVKFDGLGDTIESAWARVAMDSAGADRGAVFVPSVNDQVLVGFEGGDARRPVVLGGLYSKRDKIPADTVVQGVVESQRITSRTGHVIELNDGNERTKNHILLNHATGKHKLRIGKDAATLEVPAGVPITVKSGSSSITLGDDGAITIEGKKITFKAEQDVVIQGLNVTVKADVKAAMSGAQIDVKGTAKAAIDGGGLATLKGGMVQIN